ncbi:MAG: HNH endonuclease [Armatimonadetes bacterium]|nr:HNH endonuclease [Armatimonadota bacterium]
MALPKTPNRITTSFAFSYVERAILEGLGRRSFGKPEHAQVAAFFADGESEPSCAYCGMPEPKRWDHVLPVRAGGETVLGNMVLACAACDDSKQHRPFEDWLRARGVQDAEARIERIIAYRTHFGYEPRVLEDRLDEAQARQLEALRAEAADLRRRIDGFLSSLDS